MKSIKSMILTTLTLLIVSTGGILAVSARSESEIVSWANEMRDKWVTDEKGNRIGQCTDLIWKYTMDNFGFGLILSPLEFNSFSVSELLPEGWRKIPYTSGFEPVPGDIVYWKPGSLINEYNTEIEVYATGHAAIVVSVTDSGWVTIDTNWNAGEPKVGTPARFHHRKGYDLVIGVLRPPLSDEPRPSETPEPPAQTEPPGKGPSPWAQAQVSAAIAANLVPESLQSRYTQPITRAEFCALATALYEAVIGREITSREKFADTADPNVEKMAALGVVSGVGGNKFAPFERLTREQAAVMLSRLAFALGKPLPKQAASFADYNAISSWAAENVGQVQATGIMSGVGDNKFAPKDQYTIEQSIVTVFRLFEVVRYTGR